MASSPTAGEDVIHVQATATQLKEMGLDQEQERRHQEKARSIFRETFGRMQNPIWKGQISHTWPQTDREEWDVKHMRRYRTGGSEVELVEVEMTDTLV